MNYNESKIDPAVLRSVEEMGFTKMTPIQEMTIPVLLEGRDVIGQAQTGTGKTAAFGIPMIMAVNNAIEAGEKVKGVQGLILCPTRELAMQATEELRKMAKYTHDVKVVAIYGGQDIDRQIRALKGGAAIVVGTPGRVMDHMRRRTLKFDKLKMLVLDEADEMLNMGFREDIETICVALPVERQTALFSATMSEEILEIATQYQKNAKLLKVKTEELTIPLIKQFFYVVKGREKDTALCRLVDFMIPKKALVFCNTKRKVDELTLMLKGRGYSAEALHGDLSQHQRDRVMNLFRNGTLEILLATDVAARGLDIDDVEMVFNYDMPQDMEYYVHRIGRTGRAGKKGSAFSIITSREMYKIESLRKFCNADIERRDLPSATKVNAVKADKILQNAIDYSKDKDLTQFMQIVYKKAVEEDMDALEIAAAFLSMEAGPLLIDEPEEKGGKLFGKGSGGRGREGQRRDGRGREGRKKEGRKPKDSYTRAANKDARKGDKEKAAARPGDHRETGGSRDSRKKPGKEIFGGKRGYNDSNNASKKGKPNGKRTKSSN